MCRWAHQHLCRINILGNKYGYFGSVWILSNSYSWQVLFSHVLHQDIFVAVTQNGSSVMLGMEHLVVCVPARTCRVIYLIKQQRNINFSWVQVYQVCPHVLHVAKYLHTSRAWFFKRLCTKQRKCGMCAWIFEKTLHRRERVWERLKITLRKKNNATCPRKGLAKHLRPCQTKTSYFWTFRVGFYNLSVVERGLILHFQSRVRVHHWLRDCDQSFVPALEGPKLVFIFSNGQDPLAVGLHLSLSYVYVTNKVYLKNNSSHQEYYPALSILP